jgi:hypothetical protein
MTPSEYLEAILREQTLAPGGPELKALQQHRKDVEQLLRKAFGNSPVIREGGSKAKGTMIKVAYDLDLTCYFPHEEDDAGQSLKEIYENVEKILANNYRVIRKGSAVRLMDPDGQTDFHIDVVPGRFVDGEEGDVFLYCSSGDKERLKTNLHVHIAHVRDSGVVDAIRLMKLWRERNAINVKTFVLELLTIKLLQGKKQKKLSDQLLHVWEQLRDNVQDLAIEDPANPEGNDLSELFSGAVRAQLSSTSGRTVQTIEQSGWEGVFGKVETEKSERVEALKRISVVSAPAKPWFSGK